MKIQSITHSALISFICALLCTIGATSWEFFTAPAEIFRSNEGLRWGILAETAWSWFWPLLLVFVALCLLVNLIFKYFYLRRA